MMTLYSLSKIYSSHHFSNNIDIPTEPKPTRFAYHSEEFKLCIGVERFIKRGYAHILANSTARSAVMGYSFSQPAIVNEDLLEDFSE